VNGVGERRVGKLRGTVVMFGANHICWVSANVDCQPIMLCELLIKIEDICYVRRNIHLLKEFFILFSFYVCHFRKRRSKAQICTVFMRFS
jgi:hypothetical protein